MSKSYTCAPSIFKCANLILNHAVYRQTLRAKAGMLQIILINYANELIITVMLASRYHTDDIVFHTAQSKKLKEEQMLCILRKCTILLWYGFLIKDDQMLDNY